MTATHTPVKSVEKEFVYLASALSGQFPDLELSFNLKSGSSTMRCLLTQFPEKVVELSLGDMTMETTLREAIFSIKELTRRFDA